MVKTIETFNDGEVKELIITRTDNEFTVNITTEKEIMVYTVYAQSQGELFIETAQWQNP